MEVEVGMEKTGNEVGIRDTGTTPPPPGLPLLPRHFADFSPVLASICASDLDVSTLYRGGCVEERGLFNEL